MHFTKGLLGFRVKYNFRDELTLVDSMQNITTRKTRGKTTKAKDPEDQEGVREYNGIHKIAKEKYKDIIELMKFVPPI